MKPMPREKGSQRGRGVKGGGMGRETEGIAESAGAAGAPHPCTHGCTHLRGNLCTDGALPRDGVGVVVGGDEDAPVRLSSRHGVRLAQAGLRVRQGSQEMAVWLRGMRRQVKDGRGCLFGGGTCVSL